MKKLARKFLAMLLTAAIAVSGLVVTSVTAGAKGMFDDAIELEALELSSLNNLEANDSIYYEITVPKPGDIIIRCDDYSSLDWAFMDSNGVTIKGDYRGLNTYGEIKELSKGTYYLKISERYGDGYIKNLSYAFSPAQKATVSISATIKKGQTLQLGSVTENYDGKVTWLSTKKSVATVSNKGLVTAKKAGTTYIRAQLDNGDYVEIKVVVKKK